MRTFLCLAALVLASSAYAGPMEHYFADGVLGVNWGAPLAEVQARFPEGFTWEPAKTFVTDFVHEARVATSLFGLESQELPVHFTFDKDEKLSGVHIYYDYDRKEDVLYQVAETLGQTYHTSSNKIETRFSWDSQSGLRIVLSIGHRAPHKWAVVSIYTRNQRGW